MIHVISNWLLYEYGGMAGDVAFLNECGKRSAGSASQ